MPPSLHTLRVAVPSGARTYEKEEYTRDQNRIPNQESSADCRQRRYHRRDAEATGCGETRPDDGGPLLQEFFHGSDLLLR